MQRVSTWISPRSYWGGGLARMVSNLNPSAGPIFDHGWGCRGAHGAITTQGLSITHVGGARAGSEGGTKGLTPAGSHLDHVRGVGGGTKCLHQGVLVPGFFDELERWMCGRYDRSACMQVPCHVQSDDYSACRQTDA